jgi:hypothetical protein
MLSTRTASVGNCTTKIRNQFCQLYASTVAVILYGSQTVLERVEMTSETPQRPNNADNTDKWQELEKYKINILLSRVSVTLDVVSIGEWIY